MIAFADLYCGAGGATTGVLLATKRRKLGIKSGVAINHWPVAIETHSANHPKVKHLCDSIASVDPCVAVPGGFLDLLWASPECTHHSRARGGKPRQNQSRSGANHVLAWLDKLYVKNVIIENVPEFQDWGPMTKAGVPMKSKKGESFRTFIESLRARNYNVEYRVLNAADYGDPTSRKRLFVIARRKPLRIVWPEPSHRKPGLTTDLFGKAKAWRTARSIIDWSDLGTALSARKKPLSENTMRRIAAGLEKFCGMPFVLPTNFGERPGQSPRVNSADAPLGTVNGSGNHAVATPFLVKFHGNHKGRKDGANRNHSVDEPIKTLDTENRIALATPFLVQTDNTGGNGKCVRSVDAPVPTTVTKQNCAVVTPFLVSLAHGAEAGEDQSRRAISPDAPLPTVQCANKFGIAQPFLVSTRHGKGKKGLRTHDLAKPMPTATAKGEWGVVQPYIVKYYGTGGAQGVEEPLSSVTCKDRFLLVNPVTQEQHELEIYFRLLKPGELAAAHSFPKDYKFAGTKTDIVKQIGNSNPVELTAALTNAVL